MIITITAVIVSNAGPVRWVLTIPEWLRRRKALDLTQAELLARALRVPEQPERRDQFFAEAGADLHTALHRMIAAGDAEIALRLTNVLLPFWEVLGFLREGLDMAGRTLAMPGPSDPELRIAVARQTASEFARAHGRVVDIPTQLNQLGRVMIEQGLYAEAHAALEECLQLLRDSPSAPEAAIARVQLGEIALFEGRSADARAILEGGIDSLSKGEYIFLAMAYSDLAEIAMLAGDYAGARERLLQVLPYARLHIRRAVYTLSGAGGWLALNPQGKTGQRIEAARLFGAVQNLTDRSSIVLVPYYRRLNEDRILLLSRILRPQSWRRAFDEGRAWSLEQAIQHAREYLEAASLADHKS